MEPSLSTKNIFSHNRLAGFFNYIQPGEVVPHFFSKGSYYLTRDEQAKKLKGTVNSCLHRGFKLVSQRQPLPPDNLVKCKFHGWKYDCEGKLVESPGFDREVRGCLGDVPLVDLFGFSFEEASIKSIPHLSRFFELTSELGVQYSDFTFDQETVSFFHVNWEPILEIYLGAYHHETAHGRGLGKFIKNDSQWIAEQEFAISVHDINDSGITSPGWFEFARQVKKHNWDKPWGAAFGTIFPGLMLELYPHVLVLNQLVPLSEELTAQYTQIYFDSVVWEDLDFRNAFADAFSETAQETAALQDLLQEGRNAGKYEANRLPLHDPLESMIAHFHTWRGRASPF